MDFDCLSLYVFLQLMTCQMDTILMQSVSLIVNERSERTAVLPRHCCGFQNLSSQTPKLDSTCRNRYHSLLGNFLGFVYVIFLFFCFVSVFSVLLSPFCISVSFVSLH